MPYKPGAGSQALGTQAPPAVGPQGGLALSPAAPYRPGAGSEAVGLQAARAAALRVSAPYKREAGPQAVGLQAALLCSGGPAPALAKTSFLCVYFVFNVVLVLFRTPKHLSKHAN